MTIDERLEAVARNLDLLTKVHLDYDREYRERFDIRATAPEKNSKQIDVLTRQVQSLTATVEALNADVQTLSGLARQDGEHIRTLARIVENA